MKDPERLLEQGASDEELFLLRAGASEEPPSSGPQRLAVALGLSTGLTATALAGSSKAVASAGLMAGSAKGFLLLGGAAITGALVLAGVAFVSDEREDAPSAAKTPAAATLPVLRAPLTQAARPARKQPEQPARSKEVTVPPLDDAHRVSSAPPAARGSKSIAGEIALLDTVRRSLASGQASAALAGLAEYGRKYATGVLRPEALLLRIEALARAGDTSSARRLAARFLRDHPKTPHEARVRALVGPLP